MKHRHTHTGRSSFLSTFDEWFFGKCHVYSSTLNFEQLLLHTKYIVVNSDDEWRRRKACLLALNRIQEAKINWKIRFVSVCILDIETSDTDSCAQNQKCHTHIFIHWPYLLSEQLDSLVWNISDSAVYCRHLAISKWIFLFLVFSTVSATVVDSFEKHHEFYGKRLYFDQ